MKKYLCIFSKMRHRLFDFVKRGGGRGLEYVWIFFLIRSWYIEPRCSKMYI
jgi:hypothetical protein